jgi:hypothetical protein
LIRAFGGGVGEGGEKVEAGAVHRARVVLVGRWGEYSNRAEEDQINT